MSKHPAASKYAFHWKAKLTDGTIISQFEDDGSVHSFTDVQDKEDSLIYFWLELQNSPEPFNVGVSLVNGSFNINEFVIHSLKDDYPWELIHTDFRIIHFRRIRKHFTEGVGQTGDECEYFIGWQTTHEGKNYKKLLKIGSDGTFGLS